MANFRPLVLVLVAVTILIAVQVSDQRAIGECQDRLIQTNSLSIRVPSRASAVPVVWKTATVSGQGACPVSSAAPSSATTTAAQK